MTNKHMTYFSFCGAEYTDSYTIHMNTGYHTGMYSYRLRQAHITPAIFVEAVYGSLMYTYNTVADMVSLN